MQFVFPTPTAIPARGYLVVAAVPADLQAVYGLANVFGPYTNQLQTSGTVKLYDEQGSLLLQVEYDHAAPWPMGADGTGHSIVLARPSYGEGDPRAWDRSDVAGGSPGAAETNSVNPLRSVVLNEILAHTDPPQLDAIELYNHGNDPVNLSGCTLSDDPKDEQVRDSHEHHDRAARVRLFHRGRSWLQRWKPRAKPFISGLRMATRAGRVAVSERRRTESRMGDFRMEATGHRLSATTFGTNNAPVLISPVGFNEIMYHPISGNDDDQYVELFNHGTNDLSLGGWKIGGGINFTSHRTRCSRPMSYWSSRETRPV